MEHITGGCKVVLGCDKLCARFTVSALDVNTCRYCHHYISAHEILAVMHEGKVISNGTVPAAAATPIPLPLRNTAEEERKQIFKTKPRASIGNKRKITPDTEGPPTWSSGRRSSAAAATPSLIMAKFIAMKRDGIIPLSNFDLAELKEDVFTDITLSTAANLTSTLKMTSTLGEFFAKKFYLYTKQTNKVLRPTQYWSQNWRSDSILASLCLGKQLFIVPLPFDNELSNLLSAADIEEKNYVEIIDPSSSSSSFHPNATTHSD